MIQQTALPSPLATAKPLQNHRFFRRSPLLAAAVLALALAVGAQAALVGHWTFDDPNNPWQETSGYRDPGTHDGQPINGAVWSAEGRPGTHTGGSLDLTAGGCGLEILNSQSATPGTQPTFNDDLANGMSIAFWAKGFPDTWCPWVSKNGESVGYQVRRYGSEVYATFTLRGTAGVADPPNGLVKSNDGSWHHYAGIWDAINGTRQLFVDGVLSISITGDYGPYITANNLFLAFGAKDWDGGSGGNFYAFTKCKMDDVRIYDAPLSADDVQFLITQEAGPMILAPQFVETFPGQKTLFTITLAPGALQTNAVTVWITNSNPTALTVPGATAGVLKLIFAQGATNVQGFSALSAAPGSATLTFASSDGALANTATVQVDTPQPPALVAQWTFSDPANPYAESSGYQAAGTHDGVVVGAVATSSDIPAGTTGYALDLTQGSLRIANSKPGDTGYQNTFDNLLISQMTVAFWVKIAQKKGDWGPFVIKDGEGDGFQVRLFGSSDQGCFTVRGTDGPGDEGGVVTINDGRWHHIAAVRDGLAGMRMLYVDGYADQGSVIPKIDTGLMAPGVNYPLYLGTGENGQTFNGYLKDVRIYNYPLSRAQVQSLLPNLPTPMVGHWTFDTAAPWSDTSGYQPAGTHDLLPVGTVAFSTEVPPGLTGQSLDLSAGNCAVVVSNSNAKLDGGGPNPYQANPTWQNTFDNGIGIQMSIAFWAKGFPNTGNPWISKKGTDFGYAVQGSGTNDFASFILRGTRRS